METGKYPEEIVEKVAQAILDNFNPPDAGHPTWWINPEVTAIAALDALGLTAEWADYLTNDGVNEYTTTSDCDGSNEERWQRRPAFALRIEATPWEVVDQ